MSRFFSKAEEAAKTGDDDFTSTFKDLHDDIMFVHHVTNEPFLSLVMEITLRIWAHVVAVGIMQIEITSLAAAVSNPYFLLKLNVMNFRWGCSCSCCCDEGKQSQP